MARAVWLLSAAVLSLLPAGHAFYLPGAAPHDYHDGEKVELFVNALTPMIAGYDNAKLVRGIRMLRGCVLKSRTESRNRLSTVRWTFAPVGVLAESGSSQMTTTTPLSISANRRTVLGRSPSL